MNDIIKKNGKTYRLVDVKEEVNSMVKEFFNWSNKEYCLEAVKQNGYALQYVKDQEVFEAITGLKIPKKKEVQQ